MEVPSALPFLTPMPRLNNITRTLLGSAVLAATLLLLIALATVAGWALLGPHRAQVERFDYAAALWVRSLRCPPMEALMGSLSGIGEMLPMALITAGIFLYLLLSGQRRSALCCALSMPGTAIMWKITSLLVLRQRPNYWMMHDSIDFGYPCGHVMNAVVVAGCCLYAAGARERDRRHWAAMAFVWALLVAGSGLSRIYVSAHFATDVFAGFLMGLIWIAVALPVLRWTFPGCRDRQRAADEFPVPEFAGRASGLSRMMQECWRGRGLRARAVRHGMAEAAGGSSGAGGEAAGAAERQATPRPWQRLRSRSAVPRPRRAGRLAGPGGAGGAAAR